MAAIDFLQQTLSTISVESQVLLAFLLFVAAVLSVSWSLAPYLDGENSLFPCEVEEQDVVTPEEALFLGFLRMIGIAVLVFLFDVADYFDGDYSLFACEVDDPPAPEAEVAVPESLVADLLSNSKALQAAISFLELKHIALKQHFADSEEKAAGLLIDKEALIQQLGDINEKVHWLNMKHITLEQHVADSQGLATNLLIDKEALINQLADVNQEVHRLDMKLSQQTECSNSERADLDSQLRKSQEEHLALMKQVKIGFDAHQAFDQMFAATAPPEHIWQCFDHHENLLAPEHKWMTESLRKVFDFALERHVLHQQISKGAHDLNAANDARVPFERETERLNTENNKLMEQLSNGAHDLEAANDARAYFEGETERLTAENIELLTQQNNDDFNGDPTSQGSPTSIEDVYDAPGSPHEKHLPTEMDAEDLFEAENNDEAIENSDHDSQADSSPQVGEVKQKKPPRIRYDKDGKFKFRGARGKRKNKRNKQNNQESGAPSTANEEAQR